MTKQYELLPCPFCGREAEITPINDYVDFRKSVRIYCKACKSSTDLVPADVAYCAEEEVVKAWNKRWDGAK